MGLEIALIAIAGVATAGEMSEQNEMAEAKEAALNNESQQMQLQTQQKTLSNYDVMQKVLDSQEAAQTVRGTSFASPSFNAIQRNAFNSGAKNQQNIDIEGELAQENIELEKQNVKSQLYASLFGDVASAAGAFIGISKASPKFAG